MTMKTALLAFCLVILSNVAVVSAADACGGGCAITCSDAVFTCSVTSYNSCSCKIKGGIIAGIIIGVILLIALPAIICCCLCACCACCPCNKSRSNVVVQPMVHAAQPVYVQEGVPVQQGVAVHYGQQPQAYPQQQQQMQMQPMQPQYQQQQPQYQPVQPIQSAQPAQPAQPTTSTETAAPVATPQPVA